MLLSLSLRNFKKHESLDVDFTAGLNGIYGSNYKGKTTILYGILFALGGASQVPGTQLARRGSDGRFNVRLAFEIAGKTYSVIRSKSTANLYADNEELLATGTTGVNQAIEKLLGMTLKEWKELRYAKQKNAHALLRYSANNLHTLLRRLVGAETLTEVQSRLKELVKELSVKASTLEEGLLEDPAKVAAECAELEERVAALADQELTARKEAEAARLRFDSLISQGNEIAARREDLQTELDGQEDIRRRRAKLQASIEAQEKALALLVSQRESAEFRLAQASEKLNSVSELPEDAAQILSSFRQLEAELTLQNERVAAAERGVEQASEPGKVPVAPSERALPAAEQALSERLAELQQLSEALERTKKAANADQVEINTQRAALKRLQQAGDEATCPTCKRPYDDHRPEQIEEELQQARETLQRLTEQGQSSQAKLERAEAAYREAEVAGTLARDTLAAVRQNIYSHQKAVESWEQAKAAAASALQAALDKREQLQLKLSSPQYLGIDPDRWQKLLSLRSEYLEDFRNLSRETARAADRCREEYENLEAVQVTLAKLPADKGDAEIERLRADIKGLDVQAATIRNTLQPAAREEANKAREELQGLSERRLKLASSLNTLAAALKLHEAQADQVRKVREELRVACDLQLYLKENSELFMRRVWGSFLATASQFCSSCTGNDIESIERAEDGSFTFYEAGERMQLEEASGAQEAIIGLAVQAALAQATPCPLNVLMLDEPTADMDGDRSISTLAALKALGSQVVFVSHHETDNSLCDNSIVL